jgi:hypothetical protein
MQVSGEPPQRLAVVRPEEARRHVRAVLRDIDPTQIGIPEQVGETLGHPQRSSGRAGGSVHGFVCFDPCSCLHPYSPDLGGDGVPRRRAPVDRPNRQLMDVSFGYVIDAAAGDGIT